MPRGMDERFENPSEEAEDNEVAADEQSDPQGAAGAANTESATEEIESIDNEPLNIRNDWDSATIYVEPEQSEDIEVTFTRLNKQLKRENVTLEKNKHFYRGIFAVAFGEHPEETKEKIRELAKEDTDQ